MRYKYDVFLSYSHEDKVVVRELAERLENDKLKVWLDEWKIGSGDPVISEIGKGLEQSRVCVLLLSDYYFQSEWGEYERNVVMNRDPNNRDKRFVFLRLNNCVIPDTLNVFLIIDYRQKNEEEYQKLLDFCKAGRSPGKRKKIKKPPENDDQNKGQDADKEKSKFSDDQEEFKKDTERLFNKLRMDIAFDLSRSESASAMKKLAGMMPKMTDGAVEVTGDDCERLTDRLLALDFARGHEILLTVYQDMLSQRDMPGAGVIRDVSSRLLPWIYVASSKEFIQAESGRGILGDVLHIPVGIVSFAEIVMAGLERRQVLWKSLEKFPVGKDGSNFRDLLPEVGMSDNMQDIVLQDLYKRSKPPDETFVGKPRDQQIRSLNTEFRQSRMDGNRVYYIYNESSIHTRDRKKFDDLLKWIASTFPDLVMIKLNHDLMDTHHALFLKIRKLIVPEGK
ncbi:MAG: toll/interleukin-1 receptor domain-containing protein [Magnetococcales bacterium]|nr:toll/interleukin-1 receptor domain-containing protein [Magnetococcales bacterium]